MPKDDRSLEGWMDTIQRIGKETREKSKEQESSFFTKNKPILEFYIIRDNEPVEYGVFDVGDKDDWLILFKVNGKYRLSNKLWYDKPIVRELCKLLNEVENEQAST